AGGELRWAASFAGPWVGRRLRGRSSGDGRTAKRPRLLPVRAAG
ncbi:SGNH/GDSL hydrolase family protein, partial [Streptomyces goshikiensis]